MKYLLLALCFLPLRLWAQAWPVDAASGKIIYAEEVPVMDGPKTELYHRARAWWKATHPQAPAWQVADFSNGVLIGRNHTVLRVPCGNTRQTWILWYTLKVEMTDDRYWYSIYELQLQPPAPARTAPPRRLALEPLVLPKATPAKSREKTAPPALPQQAQQALQALIQSLKAGML